MSEGVTSLAGEFSFRSNTPCLLVREFESPVYQFTKDRHRRVHVCPVSIRVLVQNLVGSPASSLFSQTREAWNRDPHTEDDELDIPLTVARTVLRVVFPTGTS